jgi:hypothetical protein
VSAAAASLTACSIAVSASDSARGRGGPARSSASASSTLMPSKWWGGAGAKSKVSFDSLWRSPSTMTTTEAGGRSSARRTVTCPRSARSLRIRSARSAAGRCERACALRFCPKKPTIPGRSAFRKASMKTLTRRPSGVSGNSVLGDGSAPAASENEPARSKPQTHIDPPLVDSAHCDALAVPLQSIQPLLPSPGRKQPPRTVESVLYPSWTGL